MIEGRTWFCRKEDKGVLAFVYSPAIIGADLAAMDLVPQLMTLMHYVKNMINVTEVIAAAVNVIKSFFAVSAPK